MAYKRMPFGLSNVGSTFQKPMDMVFKGLVYKLVLVYLDDITMFSKNFDEYLSHLKQDNQRDWHTKLKFALWENIITLKRSIGNSPYKLVNGKEARLPISTELPALDLAKALVSFEANYPMEVRYFKLLEVQESREKATKTMEYQ
ncbi:uncharacterized protein LOC131056012 [Cryptomeria japonica]|uniref:uncharacterized protein LOC131056012 n=1 Tax=Cryptomeria japonica TaxID=3369 RepID=UPI0025AC0359|nr:uncharacterized protein LOC131056012 [Cryptomeria japonica]